MRTIGTLVVASLIAAVLVVSIGPADRAAACSASMLPFHMSTVGARAIVLGVVERGQRRDGETGRHTPYLRVTEVLKGAAPARIDLTGMSFGPCSEGLPAAIGDPVLLFLDVPTQWGSVEHPLITADLLDGRGRSLLARWTAGVRRLAEEPTSLSVATMAGAYLVAVTEPPPAMAIDDETDVVGAIGLVRLIGHPDARLSVDVSAVGMRGRGTIVVHTGGAPDDPVLIRLRLVRDGPYDLGRTVPIRRAIDRADHPVTGAELVAALAAGGQLVELLDAEGTMLMHGILVPRPPPPLGYGPVIRTTQPAAE